MLLKDLKIYNENIISMAIIGSYNTEYWRANRSDIDILVLLNKKTDVSIEFDLEDELIPVLEKYFNYNNIHLTFLYINDFEHQLALEYIKSNDKLVLNNEKEIDFRLYINKYRRNNQWLEDLIKRDIKERSDTMKSAIVKLIVDLIVHSYKCAGKELTMNDVGFILGCVKDEFERKPFMP